VTSLPFPTEWDTKRVLFTGDAHLDILEPAVRSLAAAEGGRLRVHVMKVDHHGSNPNTSQTLLQLLDCTRLRFS
jgi:beta-lactamase superfamily II metal-dependent hydrolase